MPDRERQDPRDDSEKARLQEDYQAVLEFIDRMEQMIQFQDKVEMPASVDQIWDVFLADMRNTIPLTICALFLLDEQTQGFLEKNTFPEDAGPKAVKEIAAQIDAGMFSTIISRRQPSLIPPLVFDENNTLFLLPLATVKRIIGAVLLVTPLPGDEITGESMKLMALLVKQCALVMENTVLYDRLMSEKKQLVRANEEIRKLSRTDPLTGARNRSYLNEKLPNEVKRALRYHKSLAVILADIDHFKKVNDTHGHQAGDVVLQEFVKCIEKMVRTNLDWIARYGGEEFLVILPETDTEGATVLANRLRRAVARRKIAAGKTTIKITASFGVTGFRFGGSGRAKPTAEALFAKADQLLYQAKNSGRNTVIGEPFLTEASSNNIR